MASPSQPARPSPTAKNPAKINQCGQQRHLHRQLEVAKGGTGGTSQSTARDGLGLGTGRLAHVYRADAQGH